MFLYQSCPMGLRKSLCTFGVVCLIVLTSGCVEAIRTHGYAPSEVALSQLAVGRDTRDSVIEKVGEPVSRGVNENGGYYYIASKFRHLGAFAPKEVERTIVAMSFDDQGRLGNVEKFGLEDGRIVTISRRVTNDNIQDVQFLSQLFGSFGAGNAADFIANQSSL